MSALRRVATLQQKDHPNGVSTVIISIPFICPMNKFAFVPSKSEE